MSKIILDLCGGTGSWSRPYKEAGYDVRVIDIKINSDIRYYHPPEKVYGILAAPPCPMFSFCRTNAKQPRDLKSAMEVVYACLRIVWECQYNTKDIAKKTSLQFWALENPFGLLRRFLGHPVLTFSPYEYGDPYKKKTCLWGFFNIPKKTHNTCDNKKFDQLLLHEIPDIQGMKLTRTERRAITPPGFAKAFFEVNR